MTPSCVGVLEDGTVTVGGSSQLGVFVDYLEELFSKRPTLAEHPEHTVALGVGLCAGIKQRSADLRDIVMTDVCPFSLGVATCNDIQDANPSKQRRERKQWDLWFTSPPPRKSTPPPG